MAKASNIKGELIKQMEKNGRNNSKTGADSIQQILLKDEARVKRMKKVTGFTWGLLVACLFVAAIAGLILGEEGACVVPVGITVFQVLLLLAVVFSISYYLRSRSLNMRKIQASLAGIEEQLKQLSQDKQREPED